MKESVVDALLLAAEENGAEASKRTNYSGRGMYGKTTVGLVIADRDFLPAALIAVVRLKEDQDAREEEAALDNQTYGTADVLTVEDFIEDLSRVQSDNMGRDDMIKY